MANGLFAGGLGGFSLKPGDTVVVPEKAVGGPTIWRNVFQGAQVASSLAVAASVLLK